MPLTTGSRLGPYEVLSVLGAGGMGEVFRARDTRLGRDVALKVLPDHFASDPERLARFQREAQVLASLNHPHIAAIHGLEEVGGIRALVMELVDGDTIEERIRRGPLPLEDALPIARQIAEALEAAHEQGIVHRDLKPANVKVRPDGTVKVLDFGLAKAVEPSGATSSLSISPTITSPAMTQLGVILGTAAYMSPEQAKGKAADRRSDMWAFGCLFYEMLTGTRVFAGDDVSDTLANVLKGQPDWSALPRGTPEAIRRLLRRCLVKDPRERVADASIARIEIVDAAHESEEATPPSAVNRRRVHMTWAAAMTAVVIGAGTVVWRASSIPPALETRLEINTPATADALSFAISPDGRRLVYVALDKGQPRLWLRPLDATTAQVLAGTEGAGYPFWSPGSGSIGFFSNGKLKRVDIGGGLPRDLADAAPRGGTWNSDGVILFSRSATSGLLRIPENGGEALPATTVDPALHHRSHRFPQFLPDGRRFLFLALGTVDTEGVYVGSLDSSEITRVTAADAGGIYVPPGWLLFVRQGTLIAQRFDAANAELKGNPIAVADAVAFDATVQAAALSVSAGGLVAYRTGAGRRRQLTWFDRNGKSGGTLGAPDDSGISSPRMSPDARRATVQRVYQGNTDIAIVDSVRTIRLTRDPNLDRYAIWSPDSKWIVFDSNRKGTRAIYRKLSSGTGDEELLVEWPRDIVTNEWAHGYLLFSVLGDPKTGYDIGMVPLDADGKPRAKAQPWLNAGVNERGPAFSRDGRWITYNSDESNQYEVYVRSFPKGDVLVGPISTAGGIWPRWSPDMSEVYYIAADGTMMAAAISITATGIEAGAPKALFPTRIVGGGTNIDLGRQYDVAADGRFLINSVVEEGSSPIIVIQNWAPASQTHP